MENEIKQYADGEKLQNERERYYNELNGRVASFKTHWAGAGFPGGDLRGRLQKKGRVMGDFEITGQIGLLKDESRQFPYPKEAYVVTKKQSLLEEGSEAPGAETFDSVEEKAAGSGASADAFRKERRAFFDASVRSATGAARMTRAFRVLYDPRKKFQPPEETVTEAPSEEPAEETEDARAACATCSTCT